MTNINGFTDDELRKKHKIEKDLKEENDRVLKAQREENDRLIDAINNLNKKPEPELSEEEKRYKEIESAMDWEKN